MKSNELLRRMAGRLLVVKGSMQRRESDWSGKYWVRWSDALREAGYAPNQFQLAYDERFLLKELAAFVRELGHFPVIAELKLRARQDPVFPSPNTFARPPRIACSPGVPMRRCGSGGSVLAMRVVSVSVTLRKRHNNRDCQCLSRSHHSRGGRRSKRSRARDRVYS
jgi:hypothetical protein